MDHPVPAIACLLLAPLVAGVLVYYAIALTRIRRARRSLPTLRQVMDRAAADAASDSAVPSVCVIIPAHNEEAIIGHAVRTVLAQDIPDLRLVLVLDRCTDGTRAAALAAAEEVGGGSGGDGKGRLEIIENTSCPEGWTGKNNALRRGAEESRGAADADFLLFIDADVMLEPGAVRGALRLADERKLDLLSLATTLTCDLWFERIVQPACCFELGRLFPLDRVNRADNPRAMANGQFMLFRAEAYRAIDGHHRVKHEVLEDGAFARLMRTRKVNRPFGCFMADGAVVCRMYRQYDTFRRGWKRIYLEMLRRRVARLRRAAWRIRIIDIFGPAAALAMIALGAWLASAGDPLIGWGAMALGSAAFAVYVAVLWIIYRAQHVPLRWLPAYPVGAWITARLLAEAARDLRAGGSISWGGMTYQLEAR